MKIIDLIESRNKTFTLMYHRTSDKFFKSILTHGLLPIGSIDTPTKSVYNGCIPTRLG